MLLAQLPLLLSLGTGLAAPFLTSPRTMHLLHNPLALQPCYSLTLANLLPFAILLSTFPSLSVAIREASIELQPSPEGEQVCAPLI